MPHVKQVPVSGPRFRIRNSIRFSVCNYKHFDNVSIIGHAVANCKYALTVSHPQSWIRCAWKVRTSETSTCPPARPLSWGDGSRLARPPRGRRLWAAAGEVTPLRGRRGGAGGRLLAPVSLSRPRCPRPGPPGPRRSLRGAREAAVASATGREAPLPVTRGRGLTPAAGAPRGLASCGGRGRSQPAWPRPVPEHVRVARRSRRGSARAVLLGARGPGTTTAAASPSPSCRGALSRSRCGTPMRRVRGPGGGGGAARSRGGGEVVRCVPGRRRLPRSEGARRQAPGSQVCGCAGRAAGAPRSAVSALRGPPPLGPGPGPAARCPASRGRRGRDSDSPFSRLARCRGAARSGAETPLGTASAVQLVPLWVALLSGTASRLR